MSTDVKEKDVQDESHVIAEKSVIHSDLQDVLLRQKPSERGKAAPELTSCP